MSTLVATDLDRTLVHSARAAGPDVPGDVLCLERRRGVPTAMLTRKTAATLVELARRATWVPATTRSAAEFRRLGLGPRLGLGVGTTPRFAVCASGGVLLVDGGSAAGAPAVAGGGVESEAAGVVPHPMNAPAVNATRTDMAACVFWMIIFVSSWPGVPSPWFAT